MPTANYAVSGSATKLLTGQAVPRIVAPKSTDTCTTSSVVVYTADDGGNYDNCAKVSVVINAANATLPATATMAALPVCYGSIQGVGSVTMLNSYGNPNPSVELSLIHI